MTDLSHIRYRALADKVMSAEEAAALIEPGSNVGMPATRLDTDAS
jgi:hypothetical protein